MGELESGGGGSVAVASIIVIGDKDAWSTTIASYLANEGFLVVVDATGDVAFDHRARSADAAIVDLGLGARRATDVCAAWRSRSRGPILAVASARDEAAVLDAYAAGADHVASIDITERQLLARLRSLLRRMPQRRDRHAHELAGVLPVALDPDRGVAVIDSTPVVLTRPEFELLQMLLARPGRVVERREISEAVDCGSSNERAVDFFVRRLREKLESVDGQRRITTVRGVGFRFDVRTAAAGAEAST